MEYIEKSSVIEDKMSLLLQFLFLNECDWEFILTRIIYIRMGFNSK